MMESAQVGVSAPTLSRLRMESHMAMDSERVYANVDACFERDPPRFFSLPQVFKAKGDIPLAIVAGGPSLARTLTDLRGFQTVMVCGSAHDYAVSQGIRPDYCVLADPDPIMKNYVKNPQHECLYLLASCCDPGLFDHLQHYPVAVWHAADGADDWRRGEPGIGGGCTVTLKASNIAIALGYANQHFFGFDSCMDSPDEHHAYEAEVDDKIVPVYVNGRRFICAPYMAVQAQQFQSHHLKPHGHMFRPTIHGGGLIAEIMKAGAAMAKADIHIVNDDVQPVNSA